MEPLAPGTEDDMVDYNSLNKQETENDRLLKIKAVTKSGTYENVFELSYVNGGEHWFCKVCECPIMGKVYQHELGRRHSLNISATRNRHNRDEDDPKDEEMVIDSPSNLEIAPGEPVPPGFEGEINRQAQIQERLDGFKVGPLVALEYLIEMQDYDPSKEPQYLCILCDKKGDPRTVLTHLASYNHISQYLQKHFPSCYRALAPYMIKQYKRNWQAVLQKIAEAIEKKFGRLRPFCIDQDKFEKERMYFLSMITKGTHFSEQQGPTFVDLVVHDELTKTFDDEVRPVQTQAPPPTNFGGKAFIEREPVKQVSKRSPSPPVVARPFKKTRVPGGEEPNKQTDGGRPKGRRRSLSSVSSISSDEGRGRGGGRRMARNRSPPPRDFRDGRRPYDNRGRGRGPVNRRRSPSPRRKQNSREDEEERRRNREKERLQKVEEFQKLSKAVENDIEKTVKQYEKNPEKHPKYNDEWKLFWNRRYKELQAAGQDASKHDFKPEWIEFWGKRMREIADDDLKNRKEGLRRRLGLAEEAEPISFRIAGGPPVANPPKTAQPKENRPNMPMAARPDEDPEVILLDDKDDDPPPKKVVVNRNRDRSHSPWESDTSPPRVVTKGRRLSPAGGPDKRRVVRPNIRSKSPERRRSLEKRRSPDRGRRSPDRGGRRSPERGGKRSPDRGVRRSLDRGVRRSPDRGVIRRSPDRGVIRRSPDRGVKRSPDRGVRRSPDRGGRRSPDRVARRSPERGGRRSAERGERRSPDRGRSPGIIRSRSRDAPPIKMSKERQPMRRSPGMGRDSRDRRSRSPDSFHGGSGFSREREREYIRESEMRDSEMRSGGFPPKPRVWERGMRESSFERDMRGRERIRTVADLPWEREKMNYPHGPPRMMPHDNFYGHPSMMRDMNRQQQLNFIPPPGIEEDPDDGEVNVVSVLRLLTALEEKLGSLGPKIIDLLAQALALEKKEANSSETLLDNEINCVLFETVKEKLKGQLLAGLVDPIQERAFKKAIHKTANLVYMGSQRKSARIGPVKAEVAVPGVGAVDKAAIAKQIANALIAQGKTDVTQAELEQLINAVVGMAEASKGSGKPVTTASFLSQLTGGPVEASEPPKEKVIIPRANKNDDKPRKDPLADLDGLTEPLSPSTPERSNTSNMENLSDSDLQTLLQNFKDLSTEEQMNLINYLKKMELDEPERVERLRKFVNLGGDKTSKDIIDLDREASPNRNGRKSPFHSRQDDANPELDSSNRRKAVKIHLDSEDEDYSYEDVVKAASKNIKQKEMESNRKLVEDSIGFGTQKEMDLTDAKALISNLMGSLIGGKVSSAENLLGLPTSSHATSDSINTITTANASADFAKTLSSINMDNLASIVSNAQKNSQDQKLNFEPPPVENIRFESPPEEKSVSPPSEERFIPPENKLPNPLEDKRPQSLSPIISRGNLKIEPPRLEPPRIDPPRSEPPRLESPRMEPSRNEPSRLEASRSISSATGQSGPQGPIILNSLSGRMGLPVRSMGSGPGANMGPRPAGNMGPGPASNMSTNMGPRPGGNIGINIGPGTASNSSANMGVGSAGLLGSQPGSLMGPQPGSLMGPGPMGLMGPGSGAQWNMNFRAGPPPFSQRGPPINQFGNSNFMTQRPPRPQFNPNFNNSRFGGPRGPSYNNRW